MKDELKEQVACKLCEFRNKTTCATPQPDPEHWVCKAWLERATEIHDLYCQHFEKERLNAYSLAFEQGKFEERMRCDKEKAEAVKDAINTAIGAYESTCEALIKEAVRKERETLKKAVELIKTWHNGEAVMKLGQEQADYMWNIYYNHAPEMKTIRKSLQEEA